MVELQECLFDVAGHGDINVAFVVVPIDSEAAVEVAGPVDGEFVVGFDGIDEMLGVGFGKVLDAEVVYAEDEGGGLGAMAPEAGGEGHGFVAVGCEFFDELVERDDVGFLEAVHTATDFEIDVAVVGDVDVVAWIVPYFLGNVGWVDSHILEVLHGGAEIVVLDVEAEVASAFLGVGNGAVDVDLCVEHGDSWGAGVAGVVEFVATGCHAYAVGFGFLEADVTDKVGVGNFSPAGDLGLLDEENGAGALDAFLGRAIAADSEGEDAAPFVGEASGPGFCIVAEEQLFEGALFAGGGWSGGESSDVMCVARGDGGLGQGARCKTAAKSEAATAWARAMGT